MESILRLIISIEGDDGGVLERRKLHPLQARIASHL